MQQQDLDLIMGIGPIVQFSTEIKKQVRVGTVKQIKEVGELYTSGLKTLKYALVFTNKENPDADIEKWLEILNMILIEGITREELNDCIPELVEAAVERFLFGKQGTE
ncbi:hypothetical protein DFQ01_103237 [Paenibacillus cellulosilyticus]|uniref:Uncharacterized protein n=1 Tax=Paenibacillus cellulosilyticus TaxID=375489 RepID=A0A2V2YZW5_9BACL|nr:hypothetical protein [Paenibacillus cellulosilyticus]PWW06335.1 hypothetical protein DFQ01_103237 [Paenibacillus cellulosilyticus]QKS43449.1 hypothetical protein HUB94_02685 [Paenibacillus cellulosilyticus]QKS46313.1 hypothetical protein HUB94_19050 [Paenibacillus cellulosilyticus]